MIEVLLDQDVCMERTSVGGNGIHFMKENWDMAMTGAQTINNLNELWIERRFMKPWLVEGGGLVGARHNARVQRASACEKGGSG